MKISKKTILFTLLISIPLITGLLFFSYLFKSYSKISNRQYFGGPIPGAANINISDIVAKNPGKSLDEIYSSQEVWDRIKSHIKNDDRKDISDEEKKYLGEVTKKIAEKEYGVPVKTESVSDVSKTQESQNLILTISIASVNSTLVIMENKGQTPWMDHVRFDAELKAFEKSEKENFQNRRTMAQTIIDDNNLSQKAIAEIQNNIIPEWESDIKDMRKRLENMKSIDQLFIEKFVSVDKIPQKYTGLYQYNKDFGFITDDLISLSEFSIVVKRKTIGAIQDKDAVAATVAVNDEDRISLVISWYDQYVEVLSKKQDKMSNLLKEISI